MDWTGGRPGETPPPRLRIPVFRRQNQIVLTLLIVLDLAIVLGSWNAAYWLRFHAINYPRSQPLLLTPAVVESVVAEGLPRGAVLALLNRAGGEFQSEAALRRAAAAALAPVGLETYAPRVSAAAVAAVKLPPFEGYARVTPVLLILAVAAFYLRGVYRSHRFATFRQELGAALQGCVLIVFLAMAATFLYRDFEYSRVHMVYFGVCMASLIAAERGAVRLALLALRRSGRMVRRFVLIGDSPLAAAFHERWRRHGSTGFELVGLVTPGPRVTTPALRRLPLLGPVRNLTAILERHRIDQVVSALTLRQHAAAGRINRLLEGHYVDHQIVPDVGTSPALRMEVENFDGLPMVAVSPGPLQGWNQVLKRSVDLAGSLFALALFSPAFLLIPPLLKLTSPGPVLYAQERMGWNGKTFRMYKFRTMRLNAEQQSGPVWAKAGDARVTGIGRLLRGTSLDELPQLFNVLSGDMSLVGPRPERPVFIHEFRRRIPGYMARHKVKAGITGWAQINGWRGNTSLERRIECDLFYISNWSIGFDFRILVMTVFKGFFHRNAY
jgi:Undecaprenyl-phosphate glucose phosphotransferase